MRTLFTAILLSGALALGAIDPAAAYVGPGAGLSMLGALWGLLLAVIAAFGFVLFWPIRRLLKRRSGQQPAKAAQQEATASGTASNPPSRAG